MKWKLTCLTIILICSSNHSTDCKYPHRFNAKSRSSQPDVEQTVAEPVCSPSRDGEKLLVGATLRQFRPTHPQQQRHQHPFSLWGVLGRRFSPVGDLADGKPTRESVAVGTQRILGGGVVLQNISSLQVFNTIQKCEAERVFAGCECSSTFLDQMSIP